MIGQNSPQRSRHSDARRGLFGNRCLVRVEQDLRHRRQLPEQPQKGHKLSRSGLADRAFEQRGFDLRTRRKPRTSLPFCDAHQYLRGHLPGARRGPRILVRSSVPIVQESWFEAQEGEDLRADTRVHRPLRPVFEIGFQIEMDEAVAQRPRHREMHAALRRWIAGRNHYPGIRQLVLTQFAIENKLVAASLRHLRRGGELIEKQDALSTCRQKFWRHPLGPVCGDPR